MTGPNNYRGINQGAFAWTAENAQEAMRRYITGESATQIAKALDPTGKLTRNAVIGKVHRMGATRTDGGAAARINNRAHCAQLPQYRNLARVARGEPPKDRSHKKKPPREVSANPISATRSPPPPRRVYSDPAGGESAPLPTPTLVLVKNPPVMFRDLPSSGQCKFCVQDAPQGAWKDEMLCCAAPTGAKRNGEPDAFCPDHRRIAGGEYTDRVNAKARDVEVSADKRRFNGRQFNGFRFASGRGGVDR